MKQNPDHLLLDAPFLRNFTYSDRVIVGTVADEFDVVIKNHADTILHANRNHIGEKGVIISCISDQFGVIARFMKPEALREQADGVQGEAHAALGNYNPLWAIVVTHVGWDSQSHAEVVSITKLHEYAARSKALQKPKSDLLYLPA
jgi:hypothetical protein